MAILQCPCCGSTDISDDKKKSKGIGGGVGATLGAIAFGPLGLAAGAFLGSKIGNNRITLTDKQGRQYHSYTCKSCWNGLYMCPSCHKLLAINKHYIEFGTLPPRAGCEVIRGRKCVFCQNVFYDPCYQDSNGKYIIV